MKKSIVVFIFVCLMFFTNVCYGYEGKHIKFDIPETMTMLGDGSNYDEKNDVIILYQKNNPSTQIQITESKPDLNPISISDYYKQLENQINDSEKNAETIKRTNDQNKDDPSLPNLISREVVKVNNDNALKFTTMAKDGSKFGVIYRGKSFFRIYDISMVTNDKSFLSSKEFNQIIDSFQIKDEPSDYTFFVIIILILILIVGFGVFGVVKIVKHFKKRKNG